MALIWGNKMANIFDAIQSLRPGAQFSCGDTIDSVEWQDTLHPRPTHDEIRAELARLQLEAAKAAQFKAVGELLQRKTAAITWKGDVYQTDVTAKERLAAEEKAIERGDRPDPSPWRTLDNQLIALSNAELKSLISAVYLHHRQMILASFNHKDAIEALETVAAVEAYEVAEGWP